MYTTIKAAAVNFVPWKWHKDWNADRMEECFVRAVRAGAQLVVEPEGILEGYVANEAILHPGLRENVVEIAEPIDGPYVKRFCKLARRLKASFVFGMAQLKGRRDVYNTAVFVDHRGRICGTYDKTQLAEGYDPSWNFNRLGRTIRAFDTPFGRSGMLICNDRWNPLIARALALDGAGFICILSYGSTSRDQDRAVIARARENGVAIVEANVGVNLIVSKGEPVACDRGRGIITLAEIDIPAPPSTANARAAQREYMRARPAKMKANLRDKLKRVKKDVASDPHGGQPARPRSRPLRVNDTTTS